VDLSQGASARALFGVLACSAAITDKVCLMPAMARAWCLVPAMSPVWCVVPGACYGSCVVPGAGYSLCVVLGAGYGSHAMEGRAGQEALLDTEDRKFLLMASSPMEQLQKGHLEDER